MRLEALLVHEVRALAVAIQIRGLDQLQVRLLEAVAGLEGLVEDRLGEQVAHLEADERLAAARRGRGNLGLHAVIGRVLKLEVHLALDGNRFNQCGHKILKMLGIRSRNSSRVAPRPL